MWNNPLSSNFIVVHFHYHPRHSPTHQLLRRTLRAACCFPISDIGAAQETKHLSRCIESRCVREPSRDTPKEANCTKAVLLQCVSLEYSFSHFTLDAIPNAAADTVVRRPPARVICHLAFKGQDGNSMPHSPAGFKRGFWAIEVLRAVGM